MLKKVKKGELIGDHGPFCIYIAGPMSHRIDFNFPAFHTAAKDLLALDLLPVNPASKESLACSDKPDWDRIPRESVAPNGRGKSLNTMASIRRADYTMLLGCDGILLLPGWEESQGAKEELLVAQRCGMVVLVYAEDGSTRGYDRYLVPSFDGPGIYLWVAYDNPTKPKHEMLVEAVCTMKEVA